MKRLWWMGPAQAAAFCVTCVTSTTLGAGSATEVRELRASNGVAGDEFGSAVAVDGDWAVVGAYKWRPGDPSLVDVGRAYVLHRNQGGPDTWGEVAVLEPDLGMVSGSEVNFGIDVAIDGDTIVIGANRDGVDFSPLNFQSGTVWIYQKDAGGTDNWGLVKRLHPDSLDSFDEFGRSVDIDGDRVLVGSWRWGNDRGAAFIFERNAGGPDNWGLVKTLTVDGPIAADRHGWDVAMEGSYAVVSAADHDSIANNVGGVFVYGENQGGPGNWGEVTRIYPPTTGASEYVDFGYSIDMEGRFLVVGSPFSRPDGGASYQGNVFIYDRDAGWAQVAHLTAADGVENDRFGWPVFMEGNVLLVGSNFAGPLGDSRGRVYMFSPNEGGVGMWGEVTTFTGSNAGDTPDERFGNSIGISGSTAFVGSLWDNTGGDNVGAAYVFDIEADLGLDGDCNGNGVGDIVDILITGEAADCNGNGIPDACDIASGASLDANGDGIPDECAVSPGSDCDGDVDGNNMVNFDDLNILLEYWGTDCN